MDEVIAILQTLIQQAAEIANELTPEEMQMVMQVFAEAVRIIQESQAEELPLETNIPQVPSAEFPSSNVNGFKYDPKNQQLLIQYHGPYPQAAGAVYSYQGVPEYIFKILERGAVGPKTSGKNRYHAWIKGITPSHGAAVNALIKAGGFPYKKVA